MPTRTKKTKQPSIASLHDTKIPGRRYTQHQRNVGVEDATQAKNYWEVQKAGQQALQSRNQYLTELTKTETTRQQLRSAELDQDRVKLVNVGKGITNRTEQAKNAGLIVELNSTIDNVKFAAAQRKMAQLTYIQRLKSMDLQLASLRQTNINAEAEIRQQGIMGTMERPKLNLTRPTVPALDRLLANANTKKTNA